MDYFVLFSSIPKKIAVKYWYEKVPKRADMRKLCKECGQRPAAINYYKEGLPFYRSKCDHCSKGRKETRPLWALAGYKKKLTCEKCSFTSKFPEQFNVFYIDGNLTNHRHSNLKTICANCQRTLHKDGVKWRQGDLVPDL
jgi:hypothetical protein